MDEIDKNEEKELENAVIEWSNSQEAKLYAERISNLSHPAEQVKVEKEMDEVGKNKDQLEKEIEENSHPAEQVKVEKEMDEVGKNKDQLEKEIEENSHPAEQVKVEKEMDEVGKNKDQLEKEIEENSHPAEQVKVEKEMYEVSKNKDQLEKEIEENFDEWKERSRTLKEVYGFDILLSGNKIVHTPRSFSKFPVQFDEWNMVNGCSGHLQMTTPGISSKFPVQDDMAKEKQIQKFKRIAEEKEKALLAMKKKVNELKVSIKTKNAEDDMAKDKQIQKFKRIAEEKEKALLAMKKKVNELELSIKTKNAEVNFLSRSLNKIRKVLSDTETDSKTKENEIAEISRLVRKIRLSISSVPDKMQYEQVLNTSIFTFEDPPPSPVMDEGSQASDASSSLAEEQVKTTEPNKPTMSHPPMPSTLPSPGAASKSPLYKDEHRPIGISKLRDLLDDPERKLFFDKLIMYQANLYQEGRGEPLILCPTVGRRPLDLYELYLAVKERGGFVEVMRGDMWEEIAGSLGIGVSSCDVYDLRDEYVRHLLRFECKYDRGGIDPECLISSLQSKSRKRKAESAGKYSNIISLNSMLTESIIRGVQPVQSKSRKRKAESADKDTEIATLESSACQCDCPACDVVYKKCHDLIQSILIKECQAAQDRKLKDEQLHQKNGQTSLKFSMENAFSRLTNLANSKIRRFFI